MSILFKDQISEQEIEIKGLAGAVADEKADNIEFQRPVIQKLGEQKLKKLILLPTGL